MPIACWISKATNSHSEYVMLVTFPLQQWLRERASVVSYTYVAFVVFVGLSAKTFRHFISKEGTITST